MECFELFGKHRCRVRAAFNTVVRRIFKLSKYSSVRDVIVCIGSKPCDIILDERRVSLLQSCMQSACGVIRKCGHVLSHSKDVLRIIMENSVYFNLSAGYVKRQFFKFVSGWKVQFFVFTIIFLYLCGTNVWINNVLFIIVVKLSGPILSCMQVDFVDIFFCFAI